MADQEFLVSFGVEIDETGETLIDNCDGTVTAATGLPVPATEVLPIGTGRWLCD